MAVTKYLDKTGLTYLWGKIKAWCNATFALINHTHNAATTSANGFLSSTDKTKLNSLSVYPKITDIYTAYMADNGSNYIVNSSFSTSLSTEDKTHLQFYMHKGLNGKVEEGSNSLYAYQKIHFVLDGAKLAGDGLIGSAGVLSVPEYEGATSSANATSGLVPPALISERDYVLKGDGTWYNIDSKANDNNVVHKTGNETINGTKTFLQNIVIDKANSVLTLKANNIDATVVSNEYYFSHAIAFNDKNDIAMKNRISMIRAGRSEYDANFIQIAAINPTVDSIDAAGITVYHYRNGLTKAVAPSTLTIDELGDLVNDRDILTRDWIPKDIRIVHTTDNETIAGIKTFTDNLVMSNSKSITFDLSASTPTVSTVRDFPIVFKSQSTAGNYTFTKNPFFEIPTTASNNYGLGVGFGASALTIIGAGESARDIVAAEELTGAMEKLVLTSDTDIDFFVNCNTINKRIPLGINSEGTTFLYSICSTYPDRTRGDTVTSWNHKTLYFGDKYARDNRKFSDAHTYGMLRSSVDASSSNLSLIAFRNTVANSSWGITITAPTDTDSPCYARLTSSPAVSDDSTKIATTEWVRDATGDTALNAATASKIRTIPSGNTFVKGATIGGALVNSTTAGYGAIWNAATKDYRVACATHPSYSNEVYLCYSVTNENISSNTNTRTKSLLWNADTGVLTADTFNGNLVGIIKDTIALDTISTIPNSDTYSTIFETRTNDDKILADMYVGKNTAGSSFITLRSRRTDGASTNHAYLALYCNSDGTNKWAICPTPNTTTENSDKIATTAWIRTATGNTSLNAATATKLATVRTINNVSFDGSTNINISDFTRIFWSVGAYHKHASVVKGTNPSSMQFWSFGMTDKNGYADANTLGRFRTTLAADGTVATYITAFKNVADSTSGVNMGVKYNVSDSEGYTFAPTPATNDNSTKIATTAFVKAQNYITSSNDITGTATNVTGTVAIANGGTGATTRLNAIKALTNENVSTNATHFLGLKSDWSKVGYVSVGDVKTVLGLGSAAYTASTDYVKLIGDQTIAGNKTFSSRITLHGPMSGRGIDYVANTLTKNSAPSSNQGMYFYFLDKNGYSSSQNNTFGAVGISQYTDGTVAARLVGYSNDASTSAYGAVVAGVDSDGVAFAMATATSSTRTEGDDIVTRNWIPKDTRIVHSTGDETISGQKTFNTLKITSAGNLVGTANTKAFYVCGGTGNTGTEGAYMILVGSTNTGPNAGCFFLRAATATNNVKTLLGRPDGTLTWVGQSISTSSDERIKTSLTNVPENILDAWEDVRWGEFKFLEDVSKKGDSARLHIGLIAQAVDRVFKAKDLNACKYGILCHEEREATENESAVDLWTVRYTEALAMEAAYQRRKNKILENRISELEKRLAKLEGII